MKYNLKPDERATLELRGLYEKYGYKKYKISKFEEYSLYATNRDFFTGDKVLTFHRPGRQAAGDEAGRYAERHQQYRRHKG